MHCVTVQDVEPLVQAAVQVAHNKKKIKKEENERGLEDKSSIGWKEKMTLLCAATNKAHASGNREQIQMNSVTTKGASGASGVDLFVWLVVLAKQCSAHFRPEMNTPGEEQACKDVC